MRILYSFPHPLGRPGIGTTALAQVRGLIDLGYDVTVYTTSLATPVPGAKIVQTMVLGGHRIPHRGVGVDRALRYHDWRVARALRRSGPTFDIVHSWPLASACTSIAARKVGTCSIREVPNTHTAFAYQTAEKEAAKLQVAQDRAHSHSPNARRLARELLEYELADLLLVPSDYVRQTFLDHGVPESKLVRHRYGCDLDRFPARVVSRVADARGGLTVAFVGSGEPRKGLHYALQAWDDSGASNTGRFLIAGEIQPAYRQALEPNLRQPSVHELGFTHDVGLLLREVDVLVLPSVEEGSALVTYEAQASGCALLASDAAGALCRHPDEGLIHPAGDVATLTEHLRMLSKDRALLAQLQAVGSARRAELSWASACEQLAVIYEDHVTGRRDTLPTG